jgi:diguanylate cyclase (GGDEF)-like protein
MEFFYQPSRPGITQDSEITRRIDALNAAARDMISIAPAEGLDYCKRAYQLSTTDEFYQAPYYKGVAEALFNMASFHLERGDPSLALSQAKEAQQIFIDQHDSISQAYTLRLLGSIYVNLNEYNKAMTSLLKALEICRNTANQRLMGEILTWMGKTYQVSGELEAAIDELKKAIQILQSQDHSIYLSFAYNFLALAYKALGDNEVFQQYLQRSSELAEDMGVIAMRIDYQSQMGQLELRNGYLEKAWAYFDQAKQLAEKHKYQSEDIACSIWLSEVEHYRSNLEQALKLLLEANARSQVNHYEDGLLRSERKLSLVYAELGEYKKAYEHLQSYYQIEQRIKREKSDLKYMTMETIIRTEALQKEARIIQNKNDQIEKEIAERKWVEEALRQSEDKYRRTINLDATTSVNTLRYFYELAELELQRVNRYPHPLSLMILDIEKFNRINLQFGYVAGDQILQWVARRLKDLLRVVDVIGRYGGDAFIVLLPETSLDNAHKVASRVVQHFAKADFEVAEEKMEISFHIGLAEYEKDLSLDSFIQRAENALHKAQHNFSQPIVSWNNQQY